MLVILLDKRKTPLRGATPRLLAVLKSAVQAGTTSDPEWAGALTEHAQIAQGFLASLREFSAFDQALTDGSFLRVPLRTRVSIVTTAAAGALVGQGDPKPLTKLALADQQLALRKVVSIVAVTEELVRSVEAAALALIENELRRAVATKSDETFLDILAQTTWHRQAERRYCPRTRENGVSSALSKTKGDRRACLRSDPRAPPK